MFKMKLPGKRHRGRQKRFMDLIREDMLIIVVRQEDDGQGEMDDNDVQWQLLEQPRQSQKWKSKSVS